MSHFYELRENESIYINLEHIVKINYNSSDGMSDITFSSGETMKFNKDDTTDIFNELNLS